jgi:hypothetical protein
VAQVLQCAYSKVESQKGEPGVKNGMRLLALLVTAMMAGASQGALAAQASSNPAQPSTSQDAPSLNLPVSLDRIRGVLEQAPTEPLRGLDEKPTFQLEIRERQRIEELLATLTFNSGPAVPGGLYGYEQRQTVFPKTSYPEMQPYGVFSQGQLATVLFENVIEKYLGGTIVDGVSNLRRAEAEEAARQEVARALAEFWAYQASHPQSGDKP